MEYRIGYRFDFMMVIDNTTWLLSAMPIINIADPKYVGSFYQNISIGSSHVITWVSGTLRAGVPPPQWTSSILENFTNYYSNYYQYIVLILQKYCYPDYKKLPVYSNQCQ